MFTKKNIFVVIFIVLNFLHGYVYSSTIQLPKTGQTSCWDQGGNIIDCKGSGHDGEFQQGVEWPNPRFTNNNDGTVTDNLTSLMWLEDGACLGKIPWEDSTNIIRLFNSSSNSLKCTGYTASYKDWRLPTVNELASLANCDQKDISVWLNNNHGFSRVQSGWYWTSVRHCASDKLIWFVSMVSGFTSVTNKYEHGRVWIVRTEHKDGFGESDASFIPGRVWKTGQPGEIPPDNVISDDSGIAWPNPRFSDNDDGTILDNLTGLVWLKDANCFNRMAWPKHFRAIKKFNNNPHSYNCEEYTASYNDWRIPNRKELGSIIDRFQIKSFAPQNELFLNMQSGWYWTSSTNASIPFNAWLVSMTSGMVGHNSKTSNNIYVWAVRSQTNAASGEQSVSSMQELTFDSTAELTEDITLEQTQTPSFTPKPTLEPTHIPTPAPVVTVVPTIKPSNKQTATINRGENLYADILIDNYYSYANPNFDGFYGGSISTFPIKLSPEVVLGNNNKFISLPKGSYVVVGFKNNTIIDADNQDDIFITEFGKSGEKAEVYISDNAENFKLLGIAYDMGITSFDIADIDFDKPVTAIKIVGLDSFGGSPGFDVVSVSGLVGSVGSISSKPIANFSAVLKKIKGSIVVHFKDNSMGEVESRLWEFGDNKISTIKNPTHIYAKSGNFTVTLTITGKNGVDKKTKIDFIKN